MVAKAHKPLAPIVLSTVLLSALAAETAVRPGPDHAEPYHARIRELAASAPLTIGPWVGIDAEVASAAITLLKPNVILSRHYTHRQTGRSVGFLLVQCKDARDINGHYPPICYPAHGMAQIRADPKDWTVSAVPISGMRYEFAAERVGMSSRTVDNFIITGARYARDMQAVREQVGQYTQRFYGASQVQVVYFDAHRWTEQERQEAFEAIVEAYLPLLEEIRTGVKR